VNEDQTFSVEENKLRFEQEIAIIWGVSSHPNVITLVGYSENPRCIITKVFIFLFNLSINYWHFKKKLYNQDLFTFIKNTTKDIPSEIILKLAKDIASGMNMIHSSGIVHRDLKT